MNCLNNTLLSWGMISMLQIYCNLIALMIFEIIPGPKWQYTLMHLGVSRMARFRTKYPYHSFPFKTYPMHIFPKYICLQSSENIFRYTNSGRVQRNLHLEYNENIFRNTHGYFGSVKTFSEDRFEIHLIFKFITSQCIFRKVYALQCPVVMEYHWNFLNELSPLVKCSCSQFSENMFSFVK